MSNLSSEPKYLCSELFDAVEKNDINLVGSLINDGVDVNLSNENGELPLHVAAKRGYVELAEKLIEQGTDVDIREGRNDKCTPLQLAVKNRKLKVAKLLIEKGADVNAEDFMTHDMLAYMGGTLLHWAARHTEEEIISFLVENGADVNVTENDGRTPLCLLVRHHGSAEAIKYLIDKGADLHNSRGGTPLYWAQLPAEEKLLIDAGADVNACVDRHGENKSKIHVCANLSTLKLLLDRGADINLIDRDGNTPLHNACSLRVAKFLVENGAQVNATNHQRCTPLHIVANRHIAEFLLEKGADLRALADGGKTVLHTIAEADVPYQKFKDAKWLVDFYVQKGMDVNIRDDNGNTPLHLCIDNTDVAKRLLENGADMNAVNNDGRKLGDEDVNNNVDMMIELIGRVFTAVKNGEMLKKLMGFVGNVINCVQDETRLTILHYAVQKCQKEDVELLLTRKRTLNNIAGHRSTLNNALEHIDVNALSRHNWTPLHYASQRNDEEIVKLLLECGAAYDIRTLQGHTPFDLTENNTIKKLFALVTQLFDAVKAGDYEQVIRYVAEEKAIINALNSFGCSPLHCAIHSGYHNIAMFLMEKGANLTLANKEGCSTLHFAAARNDQTVVEELLKHVNVPDRLKEFVDMKSKDSSTALHVAATMNGSLEIVKCLLQCGATFNSRNEEGKTPADISVCHDVTNLLNLTAELFEKAYYNSLEGFEVLQGLDPETFAAVTRCCDCEGNTLKKIVEGNNPWSLRYKFLEIKCLKEEELLLNKLNSILKSIILKEEEDGFGLFD